MKQPVWTDSIVGIDQLKPYERNPRRCTKEQYGRLKDAIKSLGFHTPLLVTHDMKVMSGHQRIKALKELGYTHVSVRHPDRPLTEDEFKQIVVQANLTAGEFDFDILASDFEPRDLVNWGFPDQKLDLNVAVPGFAEAKADDESASKTKKSHTCPSCGHVF